MYMFLLYRNLLSKIVIFQFSYWLKTLQVFLGSHGLSTTVPGALPQVPLGDVTLQLCRPVAAGLARLEDEPQRDMGVF